VSDCANHFAGGYILLHNWAFLWLVTPRGRRMGHAIMIRDEACLLCKERWKGWAATAHTLVLSACAWGCPQFGTDRDVSFRANSCLVRLFATRCDYEYHNKQQVISVNIYRWLVFVIDTDCVFCEVESKVPNNIYNGWSENSLFAYKFQTKEPSLTVIMSREFVAEGWSPVCGGEAESWRPEI